MSKAWMTHLHPFSQAYSDAIIAIDRHVEAADDAELDALEASAGQPTTTNCWWAVAQVAPLVREAVAAERYRRARAAQAS